MLDTVKVPKEFEPIFQKAQEYVSKYFKEKKDDPSKGTIEIFGERYILIRAASMSVEFFDTVKNLYKDVGEEEARNVARNFLFDIAHAIGRVDARNFHNKMKLNDPIEKLSAGPVHFSHSGWAFVDIFPESRPTPDENYYLIYDHPFSFEADAWEKAGRRSEFPVCVMNAGYSSGWCEESFGIPLVASEILCKAKGDEVCRFIMAHPSKIEGYIREYLKKEQKLVRKVTKYEIPGFFKRKQIEDERAALIKELGERNRELEKRAKELEEVRLATLNIAQDLEVAREEAEKTKEELKAKNTELERFTYTLSHDLRSPLITVQGFVDMLREDFGRNEKEKVESDLKYIENGTAKMEHLLNDTLQLSRIGRFVNPPEDVPFGKIVQEALEQTAQQIKSSGVEISVVEDFPAVHVDRMRIVEVLVNLITNSINYMGEQSHPKIDIGYRIDDSETVFFVQDNGIGIDKSQHEKVFELFYTVDKSSRGTGAGLAIVKRIIEVHEGRIWIESEKGKGCTICFTLPPSQG